MPALLAHALLGINRDFERKRAEAEARPSLLLWADFLRVIPDEGISVTDLPPAARVSRRAVRPWLGLEKRGWLELEAEAPRVKVVRLTEIGQRARDRCALLSQALMAFTIDYEEQARFPMSVAAMVARAMPSGPLPLDDMPRLLGVNGSGKSLLERHGIVRVARDGKQRIASLTPAGVWIRDVHEPTVVNVARGWEDRYGEEIVDDLGARLARVDDKLADDLPDHVVIRFVPGIGLHDTS